MNIGSSTFQVVGESWTTLLPKRVYKPVSQTCAVGKSGIFRRATGQANLANRMKYCSTGQGAVV